MSLPHTYADVATDLGVPEDELSTVIQVELDYPDDYDDETLTISDTGVAKLRTHFRGGDHFRPFRGTLPQ